TPVRATTIICVLRSELHPPPARTSLSIAALCGSKCDFTLKGRVVNLDLWGVVPRGAGSMTFVRFESREEPRLVSRSLRSRGRSDREIRSIPRPRRVGPVRQRRHIETWT